MSKILTHFELSQKPNKTHLEFIDRVSFDIIVLYGQTKTQRRPTIINEQEKFEQLVQLDREYDRYISQLFQNPRKLEPDEIHKIQEMAQTLYSLEISFMRDVDLPELVENKQINNVPKSPEAIYQMGLKWALLNTTYDKEFQAMLKRKMDGFLDTEAATRLRKVQQELLDLEQTLFAYCESL